MNTVAVEGKPLGHSQFWVLTLPAGVHSHNTLLVLPRQDVGDLVAVNEEGGVL